MYLEGFEPATYNIYKDPLPPRCIINCNNYNFIYNLFSYSQSMLCFYFIIEFLLCVTHIF